jgi:hypothetical protein
MDTGDKSKFSSKTFKDKDGNYPKWLSRSKIDKLKKKSKNKKPTKK